MSYHGAAFGQITFTPTSLPAKDEIARRAAAPKCATAAQHTKAVQQCEQATTVKGIGATARTFVGFDPFSNISPCYVASLPLCPTVTTTTTTTPVPGGGDPTMSDEPAPEPEEDEPNYVLWGGLALLLVAAGGYVAYKATRK